MKKNIYRLILYIGIFSLVFKPAGILYADALWTDDEFYNALQTINKTEDSVKPAAEDSFSTVKRVENEIVKFFLMPYIIDKVYPKDKIKGDITGVLHLAWPETSPEKLAQIAPFMKGVVSLKRRYDYVINRLEQKIKAAKMIPSDAPIVAKDGEYAAKYPDKQKETGKDEYRVSYKPYKYLEYDGDALGEPVRMRDKNYEPISQTFYDELTLAFLKFDVLGFYKALSQVSIFNDGTREKPNELGEGVRSRILLATKYPGDLETIEGLIEIYVPKGWYISGDYLNPNKKPQFFLSEDSKEDLNIKGYKLSYPLADGIINNGKTARILTGDVRFPLEISRRDKEKPLHVRGTFTFELCKQKSTECRYVSSKNEITLEPSAKEEDSLHANFVRKAFWEIPKETTKDAKLDKVIYQPEEKKLIITFKTSYPLSNVAVMAEDALGTDFINPKYQIEENKITATLESPNFKNVISDDVPPIAVSASFNDREALRTVVTPEIISVKPAQDIPVTPNYFLAFLFGILINIMPATLCLLQRLMMLMKEQDDRLKILIRYALGTGLGLTFLGFYITMHPWYRMYDITWLNLAAFMAGISYLSAELGYMNFNLFRPFKGILRRGLLLGLLTILFTASFPYALKTEVLSAAPIYNPWELLNYLALIWLGILVLPSIILIFRKHIVELPLKLRFINIPYTVLYILGLLWIAWNNRGIGALILLLLVGMITLLLWYVYPLAISEATSRKRSQKDKIALFVTVQKHCAVILLALFMLALTIYKFIPIKENTIPEPAEVFSAVKSQLAEGRAVLLSLNAEWDQPQTLQNRLYKKHLSVYDMDVKIYSLPSDGTLQDEWLQIYNKKAPPLNVLFSKRHPHGLVLPSALKDTEWEKAMRNFE